MSATSPAKSVCVIGAGPSGLATARLLTQRGYAVTVIELSERAGGMCHSVEYGGQWFDVGANYVTRDYREVRKLAREMGHELISDKAFQNQMSMNADTGEIVSAMKVINSGHSMFAFGVAALRYFWYQFKYRRIVEAPGFAGAASHRELMVPFGEFLRARRMAPLQKLFMVPITAMCFGTLEEIPAPHALRYIDASRFWSMLMTGLQLPQHWPKRFVRGFGNLWVDVAGGLDVEYETTVESVRRGEKVTVSTVQNEKRQERVFDRLVVCIPPDAALGFLDADDDERRLFGNGVVRFNHYVIATATVNAFPWWVVDELTALAGDTGRFPEPVGHPYIFGKQWKQSELTLYYAPIGGDTSPDEIRAVMRADSDLACAKDPAAKFGEWRDYADWPNYFPRVTIADMSSFDGGAGWYDQVENLQGRRNTYYCHGIYSFELVESIMRYARNLVESNFD